MQTRIKKPTSLITIHEVSQNSSQWHELRKTRVTASNALKLLTGTFTWATGNNVQTRAMRRGHELEAEALELYGKIHDDVDILRVGFVTNFKYPNAGVSPDGVVGDKLVEVKCFNAERHRLAARDLSAAILAQVQMQMLVCELDSCDVVLYNPELEPAEALIIVPVEKDSRIQQNIIRCLEKIKHPQIREKGQSQSSGMQCIV